MCVCTMMPTRKPYNKMSNQDRMRAKLCAEEGMAAMEIYNCKSKHF